MKKLFNKKDILTIPNLLSVIRLALIPIIIWLYIGQENRLAAISFIILSGLTDVVDGFIARRFHMVSDIGKILDPIADKLTQAAVIICLISNYKLMIPLIIFFAIKEIIMIVLGFIVIRKKDKVNSAKWYGKLNTVILYLVMSFLIVFPGIPELVANILIIISGAVMLLSLSLYTRFYIRILKDKQ